VNRKPFIAGPTADYVLGFLAGFAGIILGVIATIVVMFLWAGSEPVPEVEERRYHAKWVSVWSGFGCAAAVILILIAIALVSLLVSIPSMPPLPFASSPPFP
jgi:hypothetical protein